MNDVVGGVPGVRVRILRLLIVLGEIGHTGALPERVVAALRDSDAEQHDGVLSAAGLRTCPRVMAVVPALRARARHLLHVCRNLCFQKRTI